MKRVVAIYVCCVAIMQLALYAVAHFNRDADWLFYFDPRIGLSAFVEVFVRVNAFPAYLSWLSAMLLAVVGVGLLSNLY
jgi:hypothetical protein